MKKLKDFFITLLKGAGIGTAMIIPGVSGGTLALILGIYEKLIYAISHVFRKFKESMGLLIPVLIGALLSFVLLAKLIDPALEYHLFPTILFFFGAVLGGLPMLLNKLKGKQVRTSYVAIAVITFAVVIGLLFTGEGRDASFEHMGFIGYLLLILVGAVSAATMVIPGVSGSAFLMTVGYYKPVIAIIDNVRDNPGLAVKVLAPMAVGMVLGIFFIAKLIEYLLKNFEVQTYWGIVGFVVASAAVIFIQNFFKVDGVWTSIGTVLAGTSVLDYILGVLLCALGFFLAYKLGDRDDGRESVPAVEDR